MKYIGLFLIVAFFFIGCKSVESQRNTNSNVNTEENSTKIEKIRLEDSTEEQKKNLDWKIPPEIREILDKAKEITISYDADENTMQLETPPNSEAKVSDAKVKKEFLDSFYSDASSNFGGMACFSPRHRLKAKYESKIVEIDICYECENFKGRSSLGAFGGRMSYERKSSAIMDKIIKKYGKKIK